MTTQTQTLSATKSGTKSGVSTLGAALLVAAMGLGLMIVTGHVQAATLHDAAHDVRHATGFPCH